jgi:NSS family neurotransmitter:Na+ symporter
MLPLGGFGIAVFAGWVMKRKDSEQALEMTGSQSYHVWKFLISYIAPAAVLMVFLKVIGVFG